jgi:acyl dehydratase
MLYVMGTHIPEYRIRASVDSSDSTNLLHHDEHARKYGFSSGLVSGIFTYSYMSRSLIEFLGKDWLERGSTEVRFVHPTYDGDEIRVTGCLTSVTKEGTLCIDYQGINNHGVACAAGIAKLPVCPQTPEPRACDYEAGRRKMHRPIILETLKVGEELAPIKSPFTWNIHWEYCQKAIRDHHPLYRQVMHPGWLLSQANLIFAANYSLPPWIHVSSAVQNYHALSDEGEVETRGRIENKYEEKGAHYIVLDLAVFSHDRCLSVIRHTAIFHIAPEAA